VYFTQANSQLEVLNVAMNGFGEEGGIQLDLKLTYAISAHHHWRGELNTTLCDNICQ
jgi:hypothetical protein